MKIKYEVRIPAISERPEDFSVVVAETPAQAKYKLWLFTVSYYDNLKYTDLRARLAKKEKEND